MVSPIFFIALPLAAAFLTVLVNRDGAARIVGILTGLALAVLAWSWFQADLPHPVPVVIAGIEAPLGIQLAMDRMSAVLAFLIAVSGVLVLLYSQSYLRSGTPQSKYYAVLLLLMGASFGVLLTRDLFNLFVFYEILCIASYILVSYEQTRASLEASIKYLILGSVGSVFMLVAIGLVYRVSGSLAMSDIAAAMAGAEPGYAIFAAVLFVLGMGIEAAIFPVNTWLPDAHSSAPSSISAVLSGFVIELALVVLLRTATAVFPSVDLLPILRYLALAGLVVGELAAFGQTELKRTLAYSSMGQIGLMLFALSLGTEAATRAGIAHLVMHAGGKSVLFLVAGYLIVRTGSRETADYRGMSRRMPLSAVLFTIAALSLVGIPPLFGFFTKFRIITAAAASGASGSWLGIGVVLFGTVIEAAYLFRIVRTLYGKPVPETAGAGMMGVQVSTGDARVRGEMELPAAVAVLCFAALAAFGALLLPLIPAAMAL